MTAETQLALDQVFGVIEPLTRFSRDSLLLEFQGVRVTKGQAHWTFSIDISNEKESGTGRLPSRATSLHSDDELDEVARETQKAAYAEMPNRIQTWLSSNARNDRELEPQSCFNGPKHFGHEKICSNCTGVGYVPCPNSPCKGGRVTCTVCDGAGQNDCTKCKSLIIGSIFGPSGRVKCRGCRGTGKREGSTCPTCNGRGEVTCPKCGGAKKLRCGKCAGQGTLACDTCKGAGRIPCSPCDHTGYLHSIRTLKCTVTPDWRVNLKDAKSEVVAELSKRRLDDLRFLAGVTQMTPITGPDFIERQYEFECIITEIVLKVANETLALVGYGNKARVFDFKSIATVLLTEDLNNLKEMVTNTKLRLWGNPQELLTATKQFLKSEVNLDIKNPAFIKDRIIDRDYVDQVKQWLPKALIRLLAPQTGLAFLLTTLVPTLIVILSQVSGLQALIGYWILIPAFVMGVIFWILLFEMHSRTMLITAFQDKEHRKVDHILGKYWILWKARGLGLGSAVLPLTITAASLPAPLG
jgi:hypothetical protein